MSKSRQRAPEEGANLLFHRFTSRLPSGDVEVEIAHEAGGFRTRTAAGDLHIRWTDLENGRVQVMLGDQPLNLRVSRTDDGTCRIEWDGRRALVRVEDDLAHRARLAHAHHSGPYPLRSPMPGTVVKLLVAEGETIVIEQPLLIVEAMKMQNEISAPLAGTIRSIRVRSGQTVEGDQILLEIDP